MPTAESIVENFSDEELKKAYYEMEEWKRSKTLPEDSIVRKMHNEIIETANANYPLFAMDPLLWCVIAKKTYKIEFEKEPTVNDENETTLD
jgi:hypothetical protein